MTCYSIAVRNEPLILTSCPAVSTVPVLEEANSPVTRNLHKNRDETRGDLLSRGFWGSGMDCIFGVRVTDTGC
jgi:hypothetical protein